MRVEDGVKYYEENERIQDLTDWYIELTKAINAIAYRQAGSSSLVSIMAEAVTEEDNEKLENIWGRYDEERRMLLVGTRVCSGCTLLL